MLRVIVKRRRNKFDSGERVTHVGAQTLFFLNNRYHLITADGGTVTLGEHDHIVSVTSEVKS